jgi:EmrB/QacA subfamily drug resistance transporter
MNGRTGNITSDKQYRRRAMTVISLGTLMSTVDMGGTRVILPYLEKAYQSSADVVVWVSLIWVLAGSSLMLSMGRASDIIGRKRVYTLGLAVSGMALILCAIAQNIAQLIIFRFIQAFGAAMAISVGNALITSAFPAKDRGKALGLMGAFAGLGLFIGPALAGACLDFIGWRSFFYVRIPYAAICVLGAQFLLKEHPVTKGKEKLDFRGAVTFFLALVCLLFVLTQGQRMGWFSPWILLLSSAGILLLIAFILMERKIEQPMLDLKMFKSRLFSIAVISHILLYIATRSISFLMPFYLIDGLGISASTSGVILMTIPAVTLVLSPFSGRLSDRLGTLALCGAGLILIALGTFMLSRLGEGTSIGVILVYLVIVGIGTGFFTSPNTSAIIGAAPQARLGSASAMIGTLRHIGMSIGLAISGGGFTAYRLSHSSMLTAGGLSGELVAAQSTVSGFQDTVNIVFVFALIGLLVSMFRGKAHR